MNIQLPASHPCSYFHHSLLIRVFWLSPLIMDHPTPNNSLEDTAWSNSGLDSWRSEVFRQSQSFFGTPSPEPLAISRSVPAVGVPLYNYHIQYPAIPAPHPFAPLPTSVPSFYLSPNTFPKPVAQSNSPCVPVQSNTAIFAPDSPYPDCYPSPWTDFTPSPSTPELAGPNNETNHPPSAKYLCPNPIPRPPNKRNLSTTSIHTAGTTVSPISPYGPDYLDPWANVIPSPCTSNLASPSGKVAKKPPKAKRPCLTRGAPQKNDGDRYGTFRCDWVGCTYDRFFSRKGVLKRHIETQHVSPGAYECPSCDHTTSRKENLKAHRWSIHKEIS
ncbi:uncharacterized protein N7511_004498 [Penicillium nucicola]|uniref:uncharacterized protein n=1 Tax=Penicillium nucicola TaxID=1850975 RepID=UPI002544F690|nr:uncharacterized protein N7511_004498 [Penicillium nucicola]KAJ5766882.1 hypothetical protein N7511_004498 [Penicillium nucicola]